MSFAIVKIIDDKLYVHSDTLVTGDDVVRPNAQKDTITKVVLINYHLAIMFGGNIIVAKNLVESLQIGLPKTFEELILIILTHQKKHDFSTDYVLISTYNRKPRVCEIKNGRVLDKVKSAWVGSNIAFSLFQKYFTKFTSGDMDTVNAFKQAYDKVFEDSSISDVGGFQLSLTQHTQEKIVGKPITINYTNEIKTAVNVDQEFWEEYGYWDSTNANVKNGDYGYTTIPSVAVKHCGVGLYFGFAKFGLLFSFKTLGIYPKSYKNVSSLEFAEEAKKIGMHLQGHAFEGDDGMVQILV